MSIKEFLTKLPHLDKASIDEYLKEAKTQGLLLDLFSCLEKNLGTGLRFDKLPVYARYLLINLLSQGGSNIINASVLLDENAKNRLNNLFKTGCTEPVFIFKEIVASLLDSEIYPDFNLVKDYALPGAPRILLLSALQEKLSGIERIWFQKRNPPLGVFRIATFLRALGVDIDFFTVSKDAISELKEQIASRDYDFIATSTLDVLFPNDLRLIFQLKEEFPHKVFIIGGQGAVFDERERQNIFKNTPVEVIGRGWGEFGLGGALLKLHHKPQNPLEAFKENVGFYVKSLEFPAGLDTGIKTDYTLDDFRVISLIFDPRMYPIKYPGRINFITTNYCPKGCVFCSCTSFLRPQPVLRLFPEDVVFYIKRAKRFYKKIIAVSFFDDHFVGSYITKQGVRESGERWIKKLSMLVKKEKLHKISYIVQLRTDVATEEIINALKQMGATSFGIGVESFSDSVLRAMKKGTTEELNVHAIEKSFNSGIIAYISLILFTPWDNLDTLWHTIDVTSKLIFKGAEFHFTVSIFFGVDYERCSAIAGMSDIECITEEINIAGYKERFKIKALPIDPKTKEFYKRVVFEDNEWIKEVKEINERENRERFLTYLKIGLLNFSSEIQGPIDLFQKRIRQRLVGTDSLSCLMTFYNFYCLADKLLDFSQAPFSESDRNYFLEKQEELRSRIYQHLFEGPIINAILESPFKLKKLRKKLKMTIYLSIFSSLPTVDKFFVNFRSLRSNGFFNIIDVIKRHIKAAELYQVRSDLETIYFLIRAEEYYKDIKRSDTAEKLFQIRTKMFSKRLITDIKKGFLPLPELESLDAAYKQFIDETEDLRLKVIETFGGDKALPIEQTSSQ